MMTSHDCLLVTDIQNDFCPGGALGIAAADEIIEPINRIMERFPLVVSTQDWHPENHCSFKAQGGPWPVHCVQNSWGADFHPKLNTKPISLHIHKAQFVNREAYSSFQETPLKDELEKRKVRHIFIVGLATDYCVKQTSLDALRYGFQLTVIEDLVGAVNVSPGDGEKALEEIRSSGGTLISSKDLLKEAA